MPGTVVFKPIEANITHNTELIGKMDPYCLFHVGTQKIKSQVCKKGGKHPQWDGQVIVPITGQPTLMVDLKDKDIFHDDKIGSFEVDLREVETQGRLKKWYPLFYKTKPAGEILMEAIFTGDTTANVNSGLMAGNLPTTTMLGQAPVANTIVGQPVLVDQIVGESRVLGQNIQTTNVIGGGMPFGYGANIPTGNIYGSQGLTTQLGDNVLPVVGGHFPSTHSGLTNAGVSGPELYAQEALLRGVDPLNISQINRHNMERSGLGYPGTSPMNQLGGLNAGTFDQTNIPINTTSQQMPANIMNKDVMLEQPRNF